MKKNTQIGDVFSANISDKKKRYLQFIASDMTQLNSDVIRVFKSVYSVSEKPDLGTVINDEVEFYAHCVTKWGIKLGFWQKVGNVLEVGDLKKILFRNTADDQRAATSNDWWIWGVSEEPVHVGALIGANKQAEIGSVIPPDSIVHRMRTGEYDFVYPRIA